MASGAWNPQWEATAPFEGAPKHLNRKVGVVVSHPFHHHGRNATHVDISRETPIVNTASYGMCYPIADIRTQSALAIEDTIADLDQLIAHLAVHRERLAKDLASIADRDFVVDLSQVESA